MGIDYLWHPGSSFDRAFRRFGVLVARKILRACLVRKQNRDVVRGKTRRLQLFTMATIAPATRAIYDRLAKCIGIFRRSYREERKRPQYTPCASPSSLSQPPTSFPPPPLRPQLPRRFAVLHVVSTTRFDPLARPHLSTGVKNPRHHTVRHKFSGLPVYLPLCAKSVTSRCSKPLGTPSFIYEPSFVHVGSYDCSTPCLLLAPRTTISHDSDMDHRMAQRA